MATANCSASCNADLCLSSTHCFPSTSVCSSCLSAACQEAHNATQICEYCGRVEGVMFVLCFWRPEFCDPSMSPARMLRLQLVPLLRCLAICPWRRGRSYLPSPLGRLDGRLVRIVRGFVPFDV